MKTWIFVLAVAQASFHHTWFILIMNPAQFSQQIKSYLDNGTERLGFPFSSWSCTSLRRLRWGLRCLINKQVISIKDIV